jgi:hypothetical protein
MGELQAPKAAPSSEHWKLEPVSLEEKLKLAELELVVPLGPESIVVWGAAVSTVTCTTVEAGELLPAASVATAV